MTGSRAIPGNTADPMLLEALPATNGRSGGWLARLLRGLGAFFGIGPGARDERFFAGLIALAAKMAKADGVATPGEFDAFRSVFTFSDRDLPRVRALYDLAKQDVAGFEAYAQRVSASLNRDAALLEDVLDGLFHVAKADGAVHEGELFHLETAAESFGLGGIAFDRIRARHLSDDHDPHLVLGVSPGISAEALKRHYRRLVAENHPDRLMARGLPPECLRIANDRLAAINAAYATLSA
ncbi:MAG: DnaJ family molecular chaperone [Pseudomonadota bacterium]